VPVCFCGGTGQVCWAWRRRLQTWLSLSEGLFFYLLCCLYCLRFMYVSSCFSFFSLPASRMWLFCASTSCRSLPLLSLSLPFQPLPLLSQASRLCCLLPAPAYSCFLLRAAPTHTVFALRALPYHGDTSYSPSACLCSRATAFCWRRAHAGWALRSLRWVLTCAWNHSGTTLKLFLLAFCAFRMGRFIIFALFIVSSWRQTASNMVAGTD